MSEIVHEYRDDLEPAEFMATVAGAADLSDALRALNLIETPPASGCTVAFDLEALEAAANRALAEDDGLAVLSADARREVERAFKAAEERERAAGFAVVRIKSCMARRGVRLEDYAAAVKRGERVARRVSRELVLTARYRLTDEWLARIAEPAQALDPQLVEKEVIAPEVDPKVISIETKRKAREAGEPPKGGRAGRGGPAAALAAVEQIRDYPEVGDAIQRFNERFAFVRMGSRLAIAVEREDRVDFMMERDFHSWTDNERVEVEVGGKLKPVPISKLWKASPARRSYPNSVTFAPERDPEPGTLNLWRGWKVEPDPNASCQRFLDHLAEVICRRNETAYRYALGWLAHLVQRPWEKPGVAFVVRGLKGAGKDTCADYVARMIGERHSPVVSDPSHVTGKFNAHIEAALFLRVEEAFWAGDKRAEGNLKTLITAPNVFIERKNIDGVPVPNYTRLFVSANADWVVPASADERRFFVLEASDERRGDRVYFDALYAEMKGEGPAALLHYLQAYDLTGFEVRDVPQTEGLAQQKLATLRGLPKWWLECLQEGDLQGYGDWAKGELRVERDELRRRFTSWLEGRRHDGDQLSPEQIGTELRKLLPELRSSQPRVDGDRQRVYIFPALAECRAAFRKYIGYPIDWG